MGFKQHEMLSNTTCFIFLACPYQITMAAVDPTHSTRASGGFINAWNDKIMSSKQCASHWKKMS